MKTINRNNYEEFFLLYVDGELDEATKLAVENFVKQNEDLKAELEMLMQTKELPCEILFADKESLLRTEGNSINENNCEEYFLLYVDNELSASKKEEVEKYVLQHPQLQSGFTTLKEVVLAPENISYGDKSNLYKTEKRRVVSLRTWQLSAAAILIGICALGVWFWQQSSSHIEVAVVQPVKNQPKENIIYTKPVDSTHQSAHLQQSTIAQQKNNNTVKAETKIPLVKKEKKNIDEVAITTKKKTPSVVAKVNKNEETIIKEERFVKPINHNNTIVNNPKEPPSTIDEIVTLPRNMQSKNNDVTSLQNNTISTQNNSYNVYPVAYKEINTNDDENSLHVGMLDLNKTKVKSLFKKAGRMFSKKNSLNNDGKLQVANFEIDTKQQ